MRIVFWLIVFFSGDIPVAIAQGNVLKQYNIAWTTASKDASESMPVGGGDIGLNVWVENGELLIYAARSGSFDENNALLKAGRLRIKLSPNPFIGKIFRQELHLQEGYLTIQGENNGVKVLVKIWNEVVDPVVHIDISSNKKIDAEAGYESWRYQDRVLQERENFGNSYKWAAPKKNIAKKDTIRFINNSVLFYHQNTGNTIFDETVAQQGMEAVKEQLYDPLKGLIFGGMLQGKDFISAGVYDGKYVDTDYKGWKLKSNKPSQQQQLALYLHTAQADADVWRRSLDSLQQRSKLSGNTSFAKAQQWWQQFWARSFIYINSSKATGREWEAGRNFQLFRYMLACNAKGAWPTKFNGGLFTVDPVYTDTLRHLTPDYRNWGGGLHTMQNQRLVYFPTIKNGDWDVLQSQLDFYRRLLRNAELRTKVYWAHGGACFTEQMENFGLPNYAEYGQNRPADFDKGVEYNAWLEYEWDTVFEFCLMMLEKEQYLDTAIADDLPFIESCLQFFDEHYQYLAKQRGRKALDEKGKLVLYPGSGGETYKMAYNSSSTIAALRTIIGRLLALPTKKVTEEKRKQWLLLLQRIPGLSYTAINGHTTIAPAKLWERINNTESMQLYPVFPWGMYGVGKPGLDTALNTWNYDTTAIKFRDHIGWKQDNIFAARLGLAADAWKYTSLKLENAPRRFPAFWGPGFDWVPDHNWGGSGMIGLQEMLMQTDDKRILLLPAWPKEIDVHFKLHAPYNTIVEAEWKQGKLISLEVWPAARKKDVELMVQ